MDASATGSVAKSAATKVKMIFVFISVRNTLNDLNSKVILVDVHPFFSVRTC